MEDLNIEDICGYLRVRLLVISIRWDDASFKDHDRLYESGNTTCPFEMADVRLQRAATTS